MFICITSTVSAEGVKAKRRELKEHQSKLSAYLPDNSKWPTTLTVIWFNGSNL